MGCILLFETFIIGFLIWLIDLVAATRQEVRELRSLLSEHTEELKKSIREK
jgi:hypothetical protein